MKIAICEDYRPDLDMLASKLERVFDEQGRKLELACFERPEDFISHINGNGAPQVSFLDIYMDNITGVQLARRIRELDERAIIIFVTRSDEHMAEGWDVGAAHYLVKPYSDAQLAQALRRAMLTLGEPERALELSIDRQRELVPFSQIACIESHNKRCRIETSTGDVLLARVQLSQLERQLTDPRFVCCHRSYIINLDHVARLDKDDFVMKNGTRVPLRTKQRSELIRRYEDHRYQRSRRML